MLSRLVLVMFLFFPLIGAAAEQSGDGETKELSGMAIVGDKEAPKSLYIVPWKSSEIGAGTGLTANLLDDSMRPVDKKVFMRQLDFYEISRQ